MATQSHPLARAALLVDGLSFHYPRQPALFANWSARIFCGLTLLRGGDGSGKTTLLRLLAGDLRAHAGVVRANGVRLQDAPGLYQQQVFWVDVRSTAFDQITPKDYFKSLTARFARFDSLVLPDLLECLSLVPHLDKSMHMLSTGTRRKVWLAAAFASGAAVTLLDEPFAALDQSAIAFVMELLDDAAVHPGRAFVLAHHEAPGQVPPNQTIDLGG
ncbi:MAG: ATP-binding cassette domain-containing protein [Polaromonas sp.]|nr:ATP-binding cassette domain-containing protein [Polaromonas sp.]